MNLDNIFEPISGFFQSSDISAISKFENDYGITFPDSYKAHLESYGRCMFSGSATIETECKSIVEIFTMYGINCDTGDIGKDLEMHDDYKENGYIPIGDDMFNNRYIIDSSNGKILFSDCSSSEYIAKLVANSFSEFLQKIEVVIDE